MAGLRCDALNINARQDNKAKSESSGKRGRNGQKGIHSNILCFFPRLGEHPQQGHLKSSDELVPRKMI